MKGPKESRSAQCGPAIKRYFILLLWCIIILMIYYQYDVPGSLQNHIMTDYHIGPYEFSYLYSVYAWPNIVMGFIGGYLIDRVLGVKVALIFFISISCLGQVIGIIGAFQQNFILLLAGRFVFGIGGETVVAVIYNAAVLWFNEGELNVVLAILANTGRIGSSLVFESSEPIYKWIEKLTSANYFLPCTILFLYSLTAIALISSIIILFLKPKKSNEVDNCSSKDEPGNEQPAKVTKCLDFMIFPLQYWLLVIIVGVYTSAFYSFLGQSQASFTSKFGVSNDTANSYVFFFSFFGAALSPCLGIIVDRKGRNLFCIFFSYVTGIIGFILVAYTYVNPFISMFFLSTSMAALLASVTVLFSYIVPEHQLGTSYGLLQGGINIALSIGTVAVGAISDKYGFQWMETFALGELLVTAPLLIWVWIIDYRGSGILNMTAVDRKALFENQKEAEQKTQTKQNSPCDVL